MTADVILDGLDQLFDVMERAAAQALPGQSSKPAFDQIQPRAGGGSDVQVKARMTSEPTLDRWMLVGRVLIHDQVQVQPAGRLLIDALQEADKFLLR